MGVHHYRPGDWTAVVTDDAVALLPPAVPADVVAELWQLTSEGRRLGAWVEYLAASGLSALPSFAMIETHPHGLRVLVRGEVDATVDGRVLSGRDYTTWREEILPATGLVTLGADEDADVAPDRDTDDGGWLPVVGGIVRAGRVRVATTRSTSPVAPPEEDDDVELTVARMPALAAAVGTAQPPAPTAAQEAPAVPDAAVPAVPDVAEPVAPDAAAPARTSEEAADAARAADTEATAMAAPTGAALPGEAPEPEDDYDFLLWPTEQAAAHRDERQATAEDDPAPDRDEDGDETAAATAEGEPAAPGEDRGAAPIDQVAADIEATRAPEPEEDESTGDEAEPWAIIDSVPGRPIPAATAGPGAPAPAGPGAAASGAAGSGAAAAAWPGSAPPAPAAPAGSPPVVAGAAPPPSGAPVDLPAPDDGDHDGHTVLTSELPRTDVPVAADRPHPAAPTVELVLSTGPRIEMARPVLIGRAPESARFAGSEPPRLVSVPGPDVSATHVEIRPAYGHVVVTDMNSTNGTVVHLPDQPAFRLQPGTGVPVSAGALIEIGADVTIRVEEATA